MSKQKSTKKDAAGVIKQALKGKKVPILILDSRWHSLFAGGHKPQPVMELEDELNKLLKRQGHLVNDIKELKKAKQKLMGGIVAGMGDDSSRGNKKKDNQQRLLLEMNERIEVESEELMNLPGRIKDTNEELMILTARYCFSHMHEDRDELDELESEISIMREQIKEKIGKRADLEEKLDGMYSLMHGLLGHDVMNAFDKGEI